MGLKGKNSYRMGQSFSISVNVRKKEKESDCTGMLAIKNCSTCCKRLDLNRDRSDHEQPSKVETFQT